VIKSQLTTHHHAKFFENWSIRKAEILQFFNFQNFGDFGGLI